MAKGKKTGGRDWKPGEIPNPKGRPPLPKELKEGRRLNKTEFELIMNKYGWCSLGELEQLVGDKSLPAFEAWIVAIMARGIKTGDWGGNEWIAQRLIGKVKEQVEVTTVKPFVVRHLDGSQTVLGATVDKGDE
jgi:hypothetical protein